MNTSRTAEYKHVSVLRLISTVLLFDAGCSFATLATVAARFGIVTAVEYALVPISLLGLLAGISFGIGARSRLASVIVVGGAVPAGTAVALAAWTIGSYSHSNVSDVPAVVFLVGFAGWLAVAWALGKLSARLAPTRAT